MNSSCLLPIFVALLAGSGRLTADPAPLPHWPQFPLRVFVDAKSGPQQQEAQTALAGFEEWVSASHGKIRYLRVAGPSDADITVRFETGHYVSAKTKSVGETTTFRSGAILKKAAIRLAEGASTDTLQAAAAHEFGHALGIQGHSADPDDLMYPVEIISLSAFGDPLPNPAPAVTTHDLHLLAPCYPRLFQ